MAAGLAYSKPNNQESELVNKEKPTTLSSRFRTVVINEEVCIGCNICVDICIMDVFSPNPEKGKPPIVVYPEECWFDGCCVDMCPLKDKGAIKVRIPLPMRVSVLRGWDHNLQRQGTKEKS